MPDAKPIEFWFDFGSPTTYLAHTQMPQLAADTGARIQYMPMLFGGVFKATGNQSPVMVPAKGRWMGGDLRVLRSATACRSRSTRTSRSTRSR